MRKTKNTGLQPALDYLQEHENSAGEDSGDDNDAAMDTDGKIPEIVGEAKVHFQLHLQRL